MRRFFSQIGLVRSCSVQNKSPLHLTKRFCFTYVSPDEYSRVILTAKDAINWNTNLYRFSFPEYNKRLKLGPGQHVYVRATIDGKAVIRPYTPTNPVEYDHMFDLIIKVYPTGVMSKYIDALLFESSIELKGPKGNFIYVHEPEKAPRYCMVAGGTGITPIFQVIRNIMKNPVDKTQVDLIFANYAPEDILFKKELDYYAKIHADHFRVFYVLERPPIIWNGGTGFVTQEMVQQRMKEDSFLLYCGPPGLVKAMDEFTANLGVPKEKFYRF